MSNQRTTVFWGDNPSKMYLEALLDLLNRGKELAPRGKRIKELRPVMLEYHNPLNRVTFLKGRVINPFFQLAESFWILSGRSDVKWLTDYNASIAQFSDDGVYFNAPYGERLRHWGKNDASGFIFNPVDQLHDCYVKLKEDPDTRQAVAFIGNPHFDNSSYTLSGGKDIACNINIKFKIRDNKLDINVDNRSNDLHWGTFGANLCQFATMQEAMASWLGIEVGTYYQESDSLHIYLDEYGAKETSKVMNAYTHNGNIDISSNNLPEVEEFIFPDEPRFSSSIEKFGSISSYFYSVLEPVMLTDFIYEQEREYMTLIEDINECPDEYLRLTFLSMFVKQSHNRKQVKPVIEGLRSMKDSSWKVSMLRFLFRSYGELPEFKELYAEHSPNLKDYVERVDIR